MPVLTQTGDGSTAWAQLSAAAMAVLITTDSVPVGAQVKLEVSDNNGTNFAQAALRDRQLGSAFFITAIPSGWYVRLTLINVSATTVVRASVG